MASGNSDYFYSFPSLIQSIIFHRTKSRVCLCYPVIGQSHSFKGKKPRELPPKFPAEPKLEASLPTLATKAVLESSIYYLFTYLWLQLPPLSPSHWLDRKRKAYIYTFLAWATALGQKWPGSNQPNLSPGAECLPQSWRMLQLALLWVSADHGLARICGGGREGRSLGRCLSWERDGGIHLKQPQLSWSFYSSDALGGRESGDSLFPTYSRIDGKSLRFQNHGDPQIYSEQLWRIESDSNPQFGFEFESEGMEGTSGWCPVAS